MVKEEQVLVYKCVCDFCGHNWRSWSLPLRCSSCKRPGWNRDRSRAETKPLYNDKGTVIGIEQTWTEPLPDRELISIDDIMSWKPKEPKEKK